jgi:hypothetical protein
MKRRLFGMAGVLAVALALVFGLAGCATTEAHLEEGSVVLVIGDILPPPAAGKAQIADGSYVCSRATILEGEELMDTLLGGGTRITYKNTRYIPSRTTKSVAIRINNGKVTEIMAVDQGQGETRKTYATATTYYSVSPVLVPSPEDLDKVSDFNEAKSMLH